MAIFDVLIQPIIWCLFMFNAIRYNVRLNLSPIKDIHLFAMQQVTLPPTCSGPPLHSFPPLKIGFSVSLSSINYHNSFFFLLINRMSFSIPNSLSFISQLILSSQIFQVALNSEGLHSPRISPFLITDYPLTWQMLYAFGDDLRTANTQTGPFIGMHLIGSRGQKHRLYPLKV